MPFQTPQPEPGRSRMNGSATPQLIYTTEQNPAQGQRMALVSRAACPTKRSPQFWEDFLPYLSVPTTDEYDLTPTGAPTIEYVADGANGQRKYQLGAANEQQQIGYYWNDIQAIPYNGRGILEWRFKLQTLPGANQRVVMGLGTDRKTNVSGMDAFVWLRLGDAYGSGVLKVESDDGTIYTAPEDPNISGALTLENDTWYMASIDYNVLSDVQIALANENGDYWRQIASMDMSNLAVNLQPFMFIMKDSGTGVPAMVLDFVGGYWERT